MATFVLPPIQFRQLPGFIRSVAEVYSDSALEDGYMKTISNLMLNLVAVRFATAKDPKGRLWKSTAESTRLGGRFASSYKVRPSGRKVTGSSKRLTDTGEFLKSYKVLVQTAKKVVVGPTGDRNENIAQAAAEKWNNEIVGWSNRDIELAKKELEAYFVKKVRGY